MRNTINNYTVDKRVKFTKGLRGGLGTRVDRWGQLLWPQSTPVHGFFLAASFVPTWVLGLDEKARVLTHRVYGTSGCLPFWAGDCEACVTARRVWFYQDWGNTNDHRGRKARLYSLRLMGRWWYNKRQKLVCYQSLVSGGWDIALLVVWLMLERMGCSTLRLSD